MGKFVFLAWAALLPALLVADVYLIDGERIEGEVHEVGGQLTICTDGMCMVIPEGAIKLAGGEGACAATDAEGPSVATDANARLLMGYVSAAELIGFLRGETSDLFSGKSAWLVVVLILLGGLMMNLTPCVLPMVPVNIMVIGKSAARGCWYGLGIAVAYGALGLASALGGLVFGELQSSPWFNLAVTAVFLMLSLSMFGLFHIDFSRARGVFAARRTTMLPGLFAFSMGAVSAVLAGACVAPVLIAVLLLVARLYAQGEVLALGLPFVLGAGMALPWPFVGAGLQVLPRPGAWMKYVNRFFALVVLALAVWYGRQAWRGFVPDSSPAAAGEQPLAAIAMTPETFSLDGLPRPVLVDCWASWCKNCAAMEKTVFVDSQVVKELERFTVVRLQAEDMSALRRLPGFSAVKGLPAFVVFE